jgi:hypothetical protein
VLPTVAQCATTPSLAGCSAVPPPSADICTIAPNSALCQVLSPPRQTSQSPVSQTSETINTLLASVGPQSSASGVQANPASTSGNATGGPNTTSADSKSSDDAKKSDKSDKSELATLKSGDTKNVAPPKTYCN